MRIDTTACSCPDPYQPIITVRGLFRGVIHIRYDCKKERQRRDNLIANRGLPAVRTDDNIEPDAREGLNKR